jgi:glycosyltransferase involved in cell wall biosynthesis
MGLMISRGRHDAESANGAAFVKILFYIHALAGGGAERVWALLASDLAKRGHDVIFATDWQTTENAAFIHPKVRLVVLGGNHLQSTLRLAQLIRREKPDASLSGISVSNLKHTLAGLLAGRLKRSILSYHGYYESEPQWLSRIGYLATPILTRLAARTVCVSEGMRRHVLSFHAPARKLTRIYNPSVLDTIAPISADTPMHEREPLIVSVGRLVAYKQTAMLVRAFARMRYSGAKLAILGEGPERPAIEAEIARLGLADRVTMIGYEDAPWLWYAKAKVLALTSRSESFGLVVVEALSRGLQA